MGFKETVNIVEALFMAAGLLLILPPIFLVRFVKFLKE